ncbi:MAG: hypothetical protein ACPG44_09190 [Polaribacter sp.]
MKKASTQNADNKSKFQHLELDNPTKIKGGSEILIGDLSSI